MVRKQPLDLEMRDRLTGPIRIQRLFERIVAVAADTSLDPAASGARPSADEREVAPVEQPPANEVLQPPVGIVRPRDDEQSGRVAVEPVNDPRPLADVSTRNPVLEQGVDERPALVPGPRVDDDAGRLVDDEQMLVLVGDAQLSFLGLQGDSLPPRDRLDFEQLATA